ncbi:MAG TPA: chemotaxis protein CheW [Sphingomonas sp.]|nr:chemotaxis protein CheW [Sphingomonas sp.]
MRKAFDRAFAEPPPPEAEEAADYLGIRVGGAAYAVALSEIGAVFADRKIAPLPSGASELLGVAGVRGDIVPVFALSAFLGLGGGDARPRWLVLAAGGRAGFAFDALDGHIRIPLASITPVASSKGFVRANAVIGKDARPIVSVASLMEHLEHRAGQGGRKEQIG